MGKFKCYAFLCTAVNEQHRVCGSMSSAGYANGYVAIPKEHPLYGISYDDVDIDVHGGLTFAEKSEVVNDLFDKNKTEYLESELPNGYWVLGIGYLALIRCTLWITLIIVLVSGVLLKQTD